MMASVIILYTRMPGYFLECLKFFSLNNPGYAVHCLCYKGSNDAPFIFETGSTVRIEYVNELNVDISAWVHSKSPSLIFVAGWSDKSYLKICKEFVSRIPVVVGMDNVWEGKLKQRVFSFFSKIIFPRYFNYIWVPGIPQERYAMKLGFSSAYIKKGLYCCQQIFNLPETQITKERYNSKELLFVGRFVDYKRPDMLIHIFNELHKQGQAKGWKLTLIGNGPLKERLMGLQAESNGSICVIDFQQPEALKSYFLNASAFCLPSKGEHWGVVVHEAASMGLPLLLSDTCGSHVDLLASGKNGFVFEDNNKEDFKNKLAMLLSMSGDDLFEMGLVSSQISKSISVQQWNNTMLELLNHPI